MTELYDIVVIGCGPAGLSAAINCKIRNKKTLLLGVDLCSEKLHKSPYIFNYLGFSKIKGEDLRQAFLKHTEDLEIILKEQKTDTVFDMGDKFNILCSEQVYQAKSVIIATGISYGQPIKGESEYLGKGLGYCATCDAPLFKGMDVAVIGYSNAGEEEANFLAELCRTTYYIPLYTNMGPLLDNVEVILDKPLEVAGNQMVTHLVLSKSKLKVDGVFIIKETASPAQLVPGLEMDGHHIKVDRHMRTNVQGLYAAGDCTGKPYGLAKSSGEGQIAALNAVGYVDKMNLNQHSKELVYT